MTANRSVIFGCLVPLLAVSWLLLVIIEPGGGGGLWEHIAIAYVFGTMFGQATLAAAWNALGPLPLLWRMPLSLSWIAILTLGLLINVAIHSNGNAIEIVLIMAMCLVGQWHIVQIPLWALAVGYGMRLRHWDEGETNTARDRQFGTRQLMILTAIVAVVLGMFRWALSATSRMFPESNWTEAGIFVFLAVAGVAMTVPLLVAALLPRRAVLATIGVLLAIAGFTWWELPLVNTAGVGPDFLHLVLLNTFQAAWVVVVVALVRVTGYEIRRSAGISPVASSSGVGLH